MLQYPDINPIAFQLGPLKVHWYGLMYLFGFIMTWLLGVYRCKKPWTALQHRDQVIDAIFYGAVGVILGGRIGYVLFYNFAYYWHHPATVFAVWDGGMSFHGGLIGVIVMMWWYSRKHSMSILDLTDFFAPMVPIGIAAGRIGNFINGELWGRVTDSPIGMVFPKAGPLPRYPSQLIESFNEGLVLFVVLWVLSSRARSRGLISAWFLLGYGLLRFTDEFFRQPDPQLGFIAFGWLTMGQLLSLPMIILGAILWWWSIKRCRVIKESP